MGAVMKDGQQHPLPLRQQLPRGPPTTGPIGAPWRAVDGQRARGLGIDKQMRLNRKQM